MRDVEVREFLQLSAGSAALRAAFSQAAVWAQARPMTLDLTEQMDASGISDIEEK